MKRQGKKTTQTTKLFIVQFAVRLSRAKRAVSPVISNLILIAAVICLGFCVLAYANSRSNNYVAQYGQSVNSDIDRLKETLTFEYGYHNTTAHTLTVYFLNSGAISVVAETLTVSNSSWHYTWNLTEAACPMQSLDNSVLTSLNVTQHAYFSVPVSQATNNALTTGNLYSIKLCTQRGSNFEYQLVA
jgi:hypothetical protein